MNVLELDRVGLSIGGREILHDISFAVEPGETLGIVGESGSGKSLTALSVMGLLPAGSRTSGSIRLAGVPLPHGNDAAMDSLRGDEIGMVFQEPMTALNPVQTIGDQIGEGLAIHGRARSSAMVRDMLDRVGLETVALDRYPHELSGGQRQRVVIAMATILRPKVLLADEPTTALDVSIQRNILDLLGDLVRDFDMGLVLVSHDLAVVAERADRLVVMRHGRIVERGATREVLSAPRHEYTRALAKASAHVPDRPAASERGAVLLEADDLVRSYRLPRRRLFEPARRFRAVDGVSLTIRRGEAVGLVGGSGCGKSTLARLLLALDEPDEGTIRFDGERIGAGDVPKNVRRRMQVVFQDPSGSFDPRHRVARVVAEPLFSHRGLSTADKRERAAEALREVGLDATALDRFPHEFSGGQRQRIAIARALVVRPDLVIADEPVSALDVSIRAQILDLFADLRSRLGLATLFITHDLTVVRAICDDVLVMDRGRIVERGPVARVFDKPEHEVTRSLLEAAPNLERIVAGWAHERSRHPV